jgi:hypothetical protein
LLGWAGVPEYTLSTLARSLLESAPMTTPLTTTAERWDVELRSRSVEMLTIDHRVTLHLHGETEYDGSIVFESRNRDSYGGLGRCSGMHPERERSVSSAAVSRERKEMAAFIITRIQTGDYDRWRPMFDQDQPRAREKAVNQRVLQSTDDGNEVFIYLEYANLEDANEARDRLVSSGVLDRFDDTHGPNVLVDAG